MRARNKIRFLHIFNYWLALVITFSCLSAECQEFDNYSIRTVVLDPGHGGKDPGALGSKSKEKDITLKIAKKIGKLITRDYPEIKIAYTRDDDRFVALRDRSQFANDQHADLFISIHCNSFVKNAVNGVETYVMGLRKSEDNLNIALRENAVITYEDNFESKYEGYDPNSEESFIIFSMIQNAYLEQSLSLASLIQKNLVNSTSFYDRGVKQDIFWVLVGTTMPSILVETGFISNPKDEQFIRSEKGQDTIAKSIFDAFKLYKLDVDHKNGITQNNHFNNPTPPETGPIFRIQLAASAKAITISESNLNRVKDVEEIKIGNKFKYCTGKSSKYHDMQPLLQEVRRIFPDAFIIALKNGVQIPLQDALKEVETHQ